MLIELGEDCETVVKLLDKIRMGEQLNHREKGDSLAELLATMIHLQTHCDEDLQTLIVEELEQLPDSE